MKSKYIFLRNITLTLEESVNLRNRILSHVLIFLTLFLSTTSISLASELNGSIFEKQGIVWQGNVVSDSLGPIGTGGQAQYYTGTRVLAASDLLWGSVDGYYGIILAPGIVAVLNGYSNVRSTGYSNNVFISNVSFNFFSDPIPSPENTPQGIYHNNGSVVYRINSTSGSNSFDRQGEASVSGGIYISPSAKSGTYSYPKIQLMPLSGTTSGYDDFFLLPFGEAGSFRYIAARLECTVSAPPTINFGTIHGLGVKENSYIAQETGNININCTSDSQDVTTGAKIQILGPTEGQSYILPLYNEDNNVAPGEIRGWVNRTADQTCSGYGAATDGLYFGDSSKWYPGGDLKVGNNTIPYVFNLCGSGKNGASNLGHASTTATVNISWD